MEGIEDDDEEVAGAGVEVALELVDDQPIGFVLVEGGGDVEELVVVGEPHLRPMRRRDRGAFLRLLLHEVRGRHRRGPFRLQQAAVDGDTAGGHPQRGHPLLDHAGGGAVLGPGVGGGNEHDEHRGHGRRRAQEHGRE